MNKTLAASILMSLLALSSPTFAQSSQSASPPKATASKSASSQAQASPSAVVTSININTATAEQLTLLSGIGANKAASIIAYREQNGPFASVEDLTKVSGIGPATIEKNRHLLSN
ncbi:ComEA family DNA-binding protein [Oceanisphaera sp. W20_SRM_FM3]|uniref:ComEA family DNA-binding protein n=1 Tax=Oceanisphaera sp. W20_SRM_FM3 TaxID=3240267 RepID=UPI003F96D4AE